MKNRVFVIVLLILIFPSLIIPASASAPSDGSYLNILDYSLPNGSSQRYVSVRSGDVVTFEMPYRTSIYDFEILIRGDLHDLQCSIVATNGNEYAATCSLITTQQGYLWRITGSGNGFVYFPMKVKLTFSSGSTAAFEQFKVWTLRNLTYNVSANGHVDMGGSGTQQPSNGNFTWDPNDFVQVRKNNTDEYYYGFEAKINLIDWAKFDYITLNGSLSNCYISSVSTEFGFPIPIEYSNFSGMDKADTISSYDITLDLTSIPKNSFSGESITLYITGTLAGLADFYIYNISGFVISSQNTLIYSLRNFFNNLSNTLSGWLQNIYNAIVGDSNNAANDFNDSVSDQNDQLDQMVDDMTAATLPDIDDIEIDIDNVGADVNNAGDVLALPLQNTLIFRVFFIAATFAMGGYVLYGKR